MGNKKRCVKVCRYKNKSYLCIAFEKQSNTKIQIRGVAQSG